MIPASAYECLLYGFFFLYTVLSLLLYGYNVECVVWCAKLKYGYIIMI